jgi:predicted aspartyl protease
VIRYRYAQQLTPPAPFVYVTLRCPATGSQAADLPAQLDTAADRTVLPGSVVEALGLVEDGRALFQGFAGEVIELPIMLIEIQVHNLPPSLTRAVLGRDEPHILLGRDVLNAYRVLLDGPQDILEIDRPVG